jgi:hypothetical protein
VTLENRLGAAAALLDVVRAYLSALSNRGDGEVSPISVVAAQHALRRRALPAQASELLKTLCMVKDAQDLGHGFYLPAPSHLVPSDGFALVVSGLPNQELERIHGCKPISAGTGRVVYDIRDETFGLPTASFSDWLEAPESTVEWTRERLRTLRFVEPHGLDGCELYQSWPSRHAARWQPFSESVLPQAGTVLLRHRGRTGQTNHYLVKVSAGRVAGMSELPHDADEVRRLKFGLCAVGNNPARLRLSSMDQTTTLNLPRTPNAELRLLSAVGVLSEEPQTGRWIVRIPNYSTSVVMTRLVALGLKVQ